MSRRSIMWIAIGVIIIFGVLFVRIYISSPGLTTQEDAEEFYRNAPKCHGVNILLNREATYVDAPGISVCIGSLKK